MLLAATTLLLAQALEPAGGLAELGTIYAPHACEIAASPLQDRIYTVEIGPKSDAELVSYGATGKRERLGTVKKGELLAGTDAEGDPVLGAPSAYRAPFGRSGATGYQPWRVSASGDVLAKVAFQGVFVKQATERLVLISRTPNKISSPFDYFNTPIGEIQTVAVPSGLATSSSISPDRSLLALGLAPFDPHDPGGPSLLVINFRKSPLAARQVKLRRPDGKRPSGCGLLTLVDDTTAIALICEYDWAAPMPAPKGPPEFRDWVYDPSTPVWAFLCRVSLTTGEMKILDRFDVGMEPSDIATLDRKGTIALLVRGKVLKLRLQGIG